MAAQPGCTEIFSKTWITDKDRDDGWSRETSVELIETMKQVVDTGVSIFTIGQYLQPTGDHLPVERYVSDQEFEEYKCIGLEFGFLVVESGALVRSSYHADEQARLVKAVG